MNESEYLNQDQEEILKELINISFGLAASLIGDMLSSYTHLNVPNIEIVNINDLDKIAKQKMKKNSKFYISKQRFAGHFNGETMFIIDNNSARIFTTLLLGGDNNLQESELKQPILELTNIITSACIGKLCEIIGSETIFSVPTIEQQSAITTNNNNQIYDNIIIIETILELEKENISGHMFILLTRQELNKLKDKLDALQ